MSWTRGQSSNLNQSPYKDPMKDDRNTSVSPNYKPSNSNSNNNNRRDNPRPAQTTQPPQQGNMRDIVASFSQEGLQTFSTIFSSSVEAAIAKTLPDLVERAIEKKMKQVVDEALQNVNDLITQFLSHIVLNTQTAIEKRLNEMIQNEMSVREPGESNESNECVLDSTPSIEITVESEPATVETTSVTSTIPEKPIENRIAREYEIVSEILKTLGRPVTSDELRQLGKNVEWGNNFTVKMNRFIQKSAGEIERVGKGVYQIKG